MIPDYILSREDARGSAADNNAIASWKNGEWTVVMIRPLNLTNDDDKALKEGVNTAYKAVMRPVEGTILTVAKDSAKQALSSAKQHKVFVKLMRDVRDKAQESLERTPTLLPILKQAWPKKELLNPSMIKPLT